MDSDTRTTRRWQGRQGEIYNNLGVFVLGRTHVTSLYGGSSPTWRGSVFDSVITVLFKTTADGKLGKTTRRKAGGRGGTRVTKQILPKLHHHVVCFRLARTQTDSLHQRTTRNAVFIETAHGSPVSNVGRCHLRFLGILPKRAGEP